MNYLNFKDTILRLAKDNKVQLRSIQALIVKHFKGKPLPYLQSIQTFVVRCGVNNPGEVFRNIDRCSYPPNKMKDKIKLQRANYPGQQVFYCSLPTDTQYASASSTCVVETAWEYIEDLSCSRIYLTISRWRNTRPLWLWVLPFSNESCQKNNDLQKIRGNIQPAIHEMFEGDSDALRSLEFISNIFCQKEDKIVSYRITAAFFNALLFFEKMTGRILDGLMYPSANTEKAGINVVLKKELIDNAILKCELAMMWSMQRNPDNPKSLNIMPVSEVVHPGPSGELKFSYIS